MSFLKKCDFYYKEFRTSDNNSECRGCLSLILIISFLIINFLYLYTNHTYPQVKSIENVEYIEKKLIDYSNLQLELDLEINETYTNHQSEFYCKPYFNIRNKNIFSQQIEFDFIRQKKTFLNSYDVKYAFKRKLSFIDLNLDPEMWLKMDSENTIFYIFISYVCSSPYLQIENLYKPYEKKINIRNNIKTYHSPILGNTKEIFFKTQHEFNSDIHLLEDDNVKQLDFETVGYVLFDDFKNFFDFSHLFSNHLTSNFKNDTPQFIKSTENSFSVKAKYIENLTREISKEAKVVTFAILEYNVDSYYLCYVRVYQHSLYYFPMLISIFSVVFKSFYILNSVCLYEYKYFDFINNNCSVVRSNISFDNNNSVNTNTIDNNQDNSSVCSKDFEKRLKKSSSNLEINNMQESSSNSDSFKNQLTRNSINKENRDIGNNYQESLIVSSNQENNNNEVQSISNSIENKIKFSYYDAICFFLPFSICRSKEVNLKINIFKIIKNNIKTKKPSYSSYTNNNFHYLVHKNLLENYDKDILLKPIYKINVDSNNNIKEE